MSRATIVFDGSVLAEGPWTGVARAFVSTLAVFATGDERCVVLLPPDVPRDALPAKVETITTPRGAVHKQLAWPRLLRQLSADLVHAPVAAVPPRLPCPSIITVHDLPWRVRPALPRGDAPQARHRLALHVSARAATAIVVPSQATARELRLELPARLAAKVHVVPHGVARVPPTPWPQHAGTLLVLGDDRPRKNRARVAAAHARAKHLDTRVPDLRFVGPPLDYVSEADKDALLRRAAGLVHLSLHEGFGLPVLEAMVRGVPVLCSHAGALAEVAGDAALLADPYDIEVMAQAMVRLCTDQDLRQTLRARGLLRAASFSLEATAAGWRRVHAAVRGRVAALGS